MIKNHVAKCVECSWNYSSPDEVKVKSEESDHARKTGHIVMHGKTS